MAKKRATGFGPRLRELRVAAGLTQAELAERAQMHLHGLTKLEQGDREPGWATVQDLAAALGVSCEAFQVAAGDRQAKDLEEAPARGKAPAELPAPQSKKKTTRRPRGS